MITLLKNDFQKEESRNIDRELALEKQKQKDPMMSEKNVNTKPVDYAALNQLSQDFETRFVPQTKLSVERAFWSQYSGNSEEPNLSTSTTIVEVVQIGLWYLDSGCSKHMTETALSSSTSYRSFWVRLNSRMIMLQRLGHNLFSVGHFCNSDLEVAFRQHTCFIRNLDGVDLLTGSRRNNLYTFPLRDMMASLPICLFSKDSKTKSWLWHRRLSHLNFGAINHLARQGLVRDNGTEFVNQMLREYYEHVGISHETSVARSPQQNSVAKRRNRLLIEAARTILIYPQASLFLWAEAVATACYTQNRSIIRLRHGKTPYELLHNKLPNLSFLHVFGALCYPTIDSENLGKLQPKANFGIFIGYAPIKKAFRIYNRRLVQKPSSSIPYVPPSRNDWDLLFQTLFDELLTPPPSVDPQAPKVIAPIADVIPPVQVESTGSPSSTTIDQDAPSLSKSQTTPETQSSVIPQDVEEDIHDIEVAHMGNDPLFGVPIPKVT
nr:integrase, catalytic region, zinc finger, CCHC-type, peptidase aspartic, catalytic [Tanacetum cinerariifolium]